LKIAAEHNWPSSIAEARAVQEELGCEVITRDRLEGVRHVAGVDVGFEQAGATTRAAVVVLTFPELETADQAIARAPTRFPYVPGYLSFREIPAVLDALAKISVLPDLILCDGQGYAHPRRFGLACHLGVLTGLPTIGVAKSRLIGEPRGRLGRAKGSWVPLVDAPLPSRSEQLEHDPRPHSLPLRGSEAGRGALRAHQEIIGAVLRSRTGVRPLYVSIGHRVSLATAIDYTLRCTTKYRLPETTRRAHRLASG
jgi:deoxyribonuclease V